MFFPHELDTAIRSELAGFDHGQLVAAAEQMSKNYRSDALQTLHFSAIHHAAYAATRMPATFAVLQKVLAELDLRMADLTIKTLLDLGAGPGTAAWAVAAQFDGINAMTLMEKDDGFIALSKKLAAFSEQDCLRQAHWQKADLQNLTQLPSHDLIIASYSLGELNQNGRRQIARIAAHATNQAFVVVEPGTPAGYGVILEIRQLLIDEGLTILAPCPHHAACPMTGTDWCHFSRRLDRPSFHRQVKNVQLGYEDEKYSYLIATKKSFQHYQSRLVRKPIKRGGHTYLDLCTKDGIKREVITKKDKEAMRRAKKIEWGDVWQ